jgi:hypothetical protein
LRERHRLKSLLSGKCLKADWLALTTFAPFVSERDLVDFARRFLRDRVNLLNKDVNICLTANKQGSHAYFPALMTCISFLDLLSGLHAGRLKGHGLPELVTYVACFMNVARYPELELSVLYEMMRHKIAHLGHPYVVFDSHSSTKLKRFARMRVTWALYAAARSSPLELLCCPGSRLEKTIRPWDVQYDHRLNISIRSIKADAVRSIRGPNGYCANLIADAEAKKRFAACMKEYYPP